jgi:hypothetical protein
LYNYKNDSETVAMLITTAAQSKASVLSPGHHVRNFLYNRRIFNILHFNPSRQSGRGTCS